VFVLVWAYCSDQSAQAVLKESKNWMVYTMGLLLRSRLESEKSRTAERGVLQLQVLVDQYAERGDRPGEAPVSERIKFFHCLAMPSHWELKRELGQRYLSLGVARTALEIFRPLQMWEDMILCYRVILESDKVCDGV
jgi:hypothetical protein